MESSWSIAVLAGIAIAIAGLSLVLHFFVSRNTRLTELPSVILIGPNGAGKTSLATALERGRTSASTHTSRVPLRLEIELETDLDEKGTDQIGQNQTCKKFLLIDTPGHGKLRQNSLAIAMTNKTTVGIVFVVDGSALGASDSDGSMTLSNAHDSAEYLHDLLLSVQQVKRDSKKSHRPISIMIAVNKLDLFTALPASATRQLLESEITQIRSSRSRSLLDSGSVPDSDSSAESDRWLGDVGTSNFKFSQLTHDLEAPIEVIGGWSSREEANVREWQRWLLKIV